ncbi:hypothetical protein [Hamadaea tsunoensis]|uniref:hypothetical protein n=1 Tax=Hamadaea tsunoensis TaxID=53368 RepID=UPI00068413BE|nr:hypothetical protein [Hamadaea tsunoensis]
MREPPDYPPGVRTLARRGQLARYFENAGPDQRRRLRTEAYELLVDLVFTRLTRRVEQRRGHRDCATWWTNLRPDCLDRFHTDMEAVLDDLFRSARVPIINLEGWVATRLNAVTIDAYRRRRGQRGALQRPRVPRWLADGLQHDKNLIALALDMLDWVGSDADVVRHDWPVEAWAERRVGPDYDYPAAERSVRADIAIVLTAMRRQPRWLAAYVERPLGRKGWPIAIGTEPDPDLDPRRQALEAHIADDARLLLLAQYALEAIQSRMQNGEDRRRAVYSVLELLFASDMAPTALRPRVIDEVTKLADALFADGRRSRSRPVAVQDSSGRGWTIRARAESPSSTLTPGDVVTVRVALEPDPSSVGILSGGEITVVLLAQNADVTPGARHVILSADRYPQPVSFQLTLRTSGVPDLRVLAYAGVGGELLQELRSGVGDPRHDYASAEKGRSA